MNVHPGTMSHVTVQLACRRRCDSRHVIGVFIPFAVFHSVFADEHEEDPCSSLPKTPLPDQLEEANLYCSSVHNHLLSRPPTDGPDPCPDSSDPECTRKQSLCGPRYSCTVRVPNDSCLPYICRRPSSRINLSYCVKNAKKNAWGKLFENAAVSAIKGIRPKMEDRFVIRNNLLDTGVSFFAVFDGHAGKFAVNYACKHLVKNFGSKLAALKSTDAGGSLSLVAQRPFSPTPEDLPTHKLEKGTIEQLLYDSVITTDKDLLVAEKKVLSESGTTALVALIDGSRLIVANVGDSRAVMCDSGGNPIQLSFEHKPELPRERKRIKAAGGYIYFSGVWRVAGVLAMSRALGGYPLKEQKYIITDPDIRIFDLSEHRPQFLVLATDGLWDVLTNRSVVDYIKTRLGERLFGAGSLARHAYSLGSQDNITVMVINLEAHVWPNNDESRVGRNQEAESSDSSPSSGGLFR